MAKFIAKISNNHNADYKRCLNLIKSAARCGCWGIQFSLFRIEQLFAPTVLAASREHRQYRRWELPIHFLKDMASCARDEGIKFGCTPYDLDSLKHVESRVDFLRVASHELPWTTIVRRCAETGLPLVLSTGMADASECWNATEAALEAGCEDLTLLHCITSYPVNREDCNLAAIGMLRELLVREFEPTFSSSLLRAGWSDNSGDKGVISRAVHYWGSDIIEVAFDLDDNGEGTDKGSFWLPEPTSDLINGMTPPAGSQCDGLGRLSAGPTEEKEKSWRADPSDGLRPILSVRKIWPLVQPGSFTKGPAFIFLPEGLGLGHMSRSLSLAEELRKHHDARIHFIIRGTAGQQRLLQRSGFPWLTLEGGSTPQKIVEEMAFNPRFKKATCILDMTEDATSLTEVLQSSGHPVVVLDQPDCLNADLVVVPSFGWSVAEEREPIAESTVGGTDYLLVRNDVTLMRPLKKPDNFESRIVVSFGGADPNRLTEKIASAFISFPGDVKIQFVVGPGFEDFSVRSAHLFMDHPTFEIIDTGDSLETILPCAGLLVTAVGVTVAEANTMGIPVAVLANFHEDALVVERLEKAGVVANLGYGPSATNVVLGEKLEEIWADEKRRANMAQKGWQLVHGQGAVKVAEVVCSLADEG